jgi:hypothetical protein
LDRIRRISPKFGEFRLFCEPWWPDKFKTGNIDRYDGSSNPKEFIQVYLIVIDAAGRDDRVKANFLPTALTDVGRSWLINLPEGSITS